MKPRFHLSVLSLLAVAAVACSDSTAPDALAQLERDGSSHAPAGSHSIRGRVTRYSGRDVAPGDTLGVAVPEPNAHVAAYYLGPVADSTSIVASVAASLTLAPRGSAADTVVNGRDTAPAAEGRSDATGAYTLSSLGNGVYRVEVTPQGHTMVYAWRWVTVRDGDVTLPDFHLPTRR